MSNLHTLADVNSHAPADANRAVPRLQALVDQHGVREWFLLPDSVLESFADQVAPGDIAYYDLKKHWTRKIVPHLDDKELNDILTRDFSCYTLDRWGHVIRGDQFPQDYETAIIDLDHRGPPPRYWMYTKHAAGHYLVNFSLRLAMLSLPHHSWRILTSDFHSTVWNGDNLLFDFNFLRREVPPKQCFVVSDEEELAPGEYMDLGTPTEEELKRPIPILYGRTAFRQPPQSNIVQLFNRA
jgi:hypothetical protein